MADRSPDQVWWPRELYTTKLKRDCDRLKAENERLSTRLKWCEELLEQTSTGERMLADAVGDADEEIGRLKAENARLRQALETIAQWDCLNPPATHLLGDMAWLKGHVRAALKGSGK